MLGPIRVRATGAAALGVACALGAGLGGCGRGGGGERAAPAGRGPDAARGAVVARVGDEAVTADDVAATMRAEGITDPRRALERTVELALLSREARRRGLDADPLIADTARRAAVQALLSATVEAAVRPDNLPADQVAAGVRALGFDLSHGELWRAAHALVRVDARASAAQRAEARARAEDIRRRVLALPSPRDGDPLRAAADAGAGRASHTVENLPPIDAQGRSARNDFDPAFTRALVALREPGDVSPVVESSFGFHVIVLQERIPPADRPLDAVRARVREELLVRLRHAELQRLLESLRARYNAGVREEAVREAERARLEGAAP